MSNELPKRETISISPINKFKLEQIKQEWAELNGREVTWDEVIAQMILRYNEPLAPDGA